MSDAGDPLLDIIGYKDISSSGTLLPRRAKINVVGGNATDNPTLGATDINVSSQDDWKNSVRIATTAGLPANTRAGNVLTADVNGAFPVIDTITLAIGEDMLAKNESTGANNGIWVLTNLGGGSTPWELTRRDDFDTSGEVTSLASFGIEEGGTNALRRYQLTNTNPVTINTTALTFAQWGGGAGSGYSTVEDEDTPLAQELVINFTGAGVTATAGAGQTNVTIPGGSGEDTNNLTTVNDTPVTITTISTTTDNSVIRVRVSVMGIDVAAGDVNTYDGIITVYRNGSSVLVTRKLEFFASYEDDASWDVTVVLSAQDILITVTGDTTNNTEWRALTSFEELS